MENWEIRLLNKKLFWRTSANDLSCISNKMTGSFCMSFSSTWFLKILKLANYHRFFEVHVYFFVFPFLHWKHFHIFVIGKKYIYQVYTSRSLDLLINARNILPIVIRSAILKKEEVCFVTDKSLKLHQNKFAFLVCLGQYLFSSRRWELAAKTGSP